MQRKRLVCAAVLAVLSIAGSGPSATQAAAPPTPADFVGLPTCMLYARGTDVRARVRAPHAAATCKTLTRQLARMGGVRWTLHIQPIHHILSPICLIADPHSRIELQVIDDARNDTRGAGICTDLTRAGWLILGQ